jgi:hypothetical protein
MPPVLAAMFMVLVFECVGQFYYWGKRVAAAFELVIAKLAISCSNPPIKIKCVPENDMKADHNNV